MTSAQIRNTSESQARSTPCQTSMPSMDEQELNAAAVGLQDCLTLDDANYVQRQCFSLMGQSERAQDMSESVIGLAKL